MFQVLEKLSQSPSKGKQAIAFIVSIFFCNAVGSLGALAQIGSSQNWYQQILKPEWNPPSWIFGPVWTFLFTLMGVSLFLLFRKKTKKDKTFLYEIFLWHLVLNVLWSFFFFYFQSPGQALGEIFILIGVIIFFMGKLFEVEKRSMYLLIPYLGWVLFASFLNFTIWNLNI